MCIGTPAMIANLKNNANNTPKKILKPVRQVEGKKIIAKTLKTLTILEVLNTFLIKAKTENGGKVKLGTQAFISILKHSKNCRYVLFSNVCVYFRSNFQWFFFQFLPRRQMQEDENGAQPFQHVYQTQTGRAMFTL